MRVISQDGRTDIPYENFVFAMTKDNFIVAIRDTIARPSEIAHGIIAKYSTEAKAQKAMGMLRGAYFYSKYEETYKDCVFDYCPNFMFPQDSEVEE